MPDVGVQGKHEMIDIQTLRTPALESAANKREAQIVDARNGTAAPAAPTELQAQPIEGTAYSAYRQTSTSIGDEEPRCGGTQWIAITS